MTKPIHPHNGHELGARVKSLRLARGLTQAQAAKAARITEAGYSHIENGQVACPRPETVEALARLFGVEPSSLTPSYAPRRPRETPPPPPPKPARPQPVPRVSLSRPLDPVMVELARAVQVYDPGALAEPTRIRSEMGLGSLDAVAVLLSDDTLLLLRCKQDWADYLAQRGDVGRLRLALEALAAVPDPPPPPAPRPDRVQPSIRF